jgi:hypothetical protein
MIATQRHQTRPLVYDPERVLFYRSRNRFGLAMIKETVPNICDSKFVERVKLHPIGLFPCHGRRRITNSARSQPGTWPIGRRSIKRHSRDSDINTFEILRVLAPHERRDACIGRFRRRAIQALSSNRVIALVLIHALPPTPLLHQPSGQEPCA